MSMLKKLIFITTAVVTGGWLLIAPPQTQAAVSSTSKISTRYFFGRKYAQFSQVAAYFKLRYSVASSIFRMVTRKGATVATFKPDSRSATINGMPVILNFAPTYQSKTAFISENDLSYTLMPLLQRSSLIRHTPMHIMIDAGHGGSDPGAIGKISREKNITLAIANELKSELQKRGFQVTMTRSGDYTVSLEQRSAHANRVKAQVFVSIHADAASPSVNGIGTFSLTPPGAPSYNTNKVESDVCKGHFWSKNSLFLSYCVQKNLAGDIKSAPNRGLKRARFAVLRNTNCPAILVETGFISNRNEEKKLNTAAYRKEIAKAIADGIVEYRNSVRSR